MAALDVLEKIAKRSSETEKIKEKND